MYADRVCNISRLLKPWLMIFQNYDGSRGQNV